MRKRENDQKARCNTRTVVGGKHFEGGRESDVVNKLVGEGERVTHGIVHLL